MVKVQYPINNVFQLLQAHIGIMYVIVRMESRNNLEDFRKKVKSHI